MEEQIKTENAPVVSREKQPFLHDESNTPKDSPTSQVGKGRKILVVDDNPVVVKALELKLKASGFSVITASDGAEGVRAARKEKPALIVLDINFRPNDSFVSLNWDGITIMQWMRKVQEVADIPVIILTMEDPSKYKEATMAIGAGAFFQKPVEYQDFVKAVLKLLGDEAVVQGK